METHISPNELMDAPAEVFEAIVDYLRRRAEEYNKASKGSK